MPRRETAREVLQHAGRELDRNPLEAYRIIMDWMERFRTVGDAGLLADAWDMVGLCHAKFGRDLESNHALETALGYAEASGEDLRICRIRKNLGTSLMKMKATHHALRCFLEALRLARRAGFIQLAAQIENNIALIHTANGNYEAALDIFRRLLANVAAYGLSPAIAHYHLADVCLQLHLLDKVAAHIREGKRQARMESRDQLLPGFSCFAGMLFRQRGRTKAAEASLKRSMSGCRDAHLHEEGVRASLELILLYEAAGDLENMLVACEETIAYGKSVGMMEETARAYELQVDGWKRLRDGRAAWEAVRAYGLFLMEREAHEATRTRILMEMELELLETARARNRLERELAIDPLTGLESYRVLNRRVLAVRKELSGPAAMLFLDLDNLKTVNDRYGHPAGDQLLIAFSRLITEFLPAGAVATRKAGDEFVVFLPQTDEAAALRFARRFLQAAGQPRPIDAHLLPLSCSIGIMLDPENRLDAVTLTEGADQAMLLAKRNGRMRCELYRAAPQEGGAAHG